LSREPRARVSRRAFALLPLLTALSGCGFRPLYRPNSARAWDPDLAAITVSRIPDRPGQILALALRENLNPAGIHAPVKWRLDTLLSISRIDLGIQRNATATTSEVSVYASYTLYDTKGAVVQSGVSRAIGDFDLLVDAYATQVAADDARDRALREVADDITLRLALFVQQQRSKSAAR
jgi:LPS-assembly lipoprotein